MINSINSFKDKVIQQTLTNDTPGVQFDDWANVAIEILRFLVGVLLIVLSSAFFVF